MARVVSLTVLTTLIVILGFTFFRVVAPFVLPLFLAGVTALMFRPLYHWFVAKTKQRPRLAAGLTTATVLLILMAPLLLTTVFGALELARLAQATQEGGGWAAAVERIHQKLIDIGAWERLQPYLPDIPEADQWPQNAGKMVSELARRTLGYSGLTLNQTLDFVGGLVSLFIAVLMYVIALYYFLADGPALLDSAESLIPVHTEYQRQLRQRFDQVVRAVILSTFLAASAQGVLTASALWFAGFRNFFMFALVSTFAAMIPLAGTWIIWVPCAIWLGVDGSWGAAIGLSLFGGIVISMADNLIRTWVLNSDARLHPLLAFISVLGGVEVMGLWGVFVGPIVASCLHALVQIFNVELRAYSEEAFAAQKAGHAEAPPSAGAPPPVPFIPEKSLSATSAPPPTADRTAPQRPLDADH